MRTLKSFLLISVGCAALAAFLPACSSSDSGSGTAAGNTATTGNKATGMTTYAKTTTPGSCASCHNPDAGGLLGPNISGSTPAGLGGWTEEQMYQVVRNGKTPSGASVCTLMPKYAVADISDQDIADIFAFTQSQMVATAQQGSYVGLDPSCATKK